MDKYYQPDTRWDLIGIKNKKVFCSKMVVKGLFHHQVPEDIKGAWMTVEYLLAHAYYHWPMYDEGLKKALLIIEMAIKLKAKEIGVSLKEKPNKKGVVYDRKLYDVIEEVFEKECYTDLKADIHRARDLRNTQMHPDKNSYMGGLAVMPDNLKLFVLILNAMFQNEDWHKKYHKEKSETKEQIEVLSNKLLVFDNGQKPILVYRFLDFNIIGNQLVLACNPIRTDISQVISNHISIHPLVLLLRDYKITESEISGFNPLDKPMSLYITDKDAYKAMLEKYMQQIHECEESDRTIHYHIMQTNSNWDMIRKEYEVLGSALKGSKASE